MPTKDCRKKCCNKDCSATLPIASRTCQACRAAQPPKQQNKRKVTWDGAQGFNPSMPTSGGGHVRQRGTPRNTPSHQSRQAATRVAHDSAATIGNVDTEARVSEADDPLLPASTSAAEVPEHEVARWHMMRNMDATSNGRYADEHRTPLGMLSFQMMVLHCMTRAQQCSMLLHAHMMVHARMMMVLQLMMMVQHSRQCTPPWWPTAAWPSCMTSAIAASGASRSLTVSHAFLWSCRCVRCISIGSDRVAQPGCDERAAEHPPARVCTACVVPQ